jgi:hypothetical protein
MDRDKKSNLYKEPSIDASYQVSVHLAEEGFQRRRLKCEKLTNVGHKEFSLSSDPLTNMATTGHSCF